MLNVIHFFVYIWMYFAFYVYILLSLCLLNHIPVYHYIEHVLLHLHVKYLLKICMNTCF